jgi:hypothetical protein
VHELQVTIALGLNMRPQSLYFGAAFEISGVDDSHLHEHEVRERALEQSHCLEQGVQTKSIEAIDE